MQNHSVLHTIELTCRSRYGTLLKAGEVSRYQMSVKKPAYNPSRRIPGSLNSHMLILNAS